MTRTKKNDKSKNAKRKNTHKTPQQQSSGWYLLPGMLMVAVVPLLLRYYPFQTHMEEFPWVVNMTDVDIFLHVKMVAIIAISAVMLLILGGWVILDGRGLRFCKAFVPMLVYALFVIISAIASEYPYFVTHGIRGQFEPVWVLLSYTVMSYYVFFYVTTEQDVERMFRALFAGCFLVTLIGVFQAFGMDLVKSALESFLIVPEKYRENLTPDAFSQDRRAYTTMYNPNYVGMYVSMMLPCLGAWMFTKKKKTALLAQGLLMVGLMITLYASQAKNGVIALIIGIGLYAAALCARVVKKPALMAGIAAGALAAGGVIFFAADAMLNQALSGGLKGIFNHVELPQEKLLEKIETGEDVTVYYNHQVLHVTMEIESADGCASIRMTDEKRHELPVRMDFDTGMLYPEDDRYEGVGVFSTVLEGSGDIVLLGMYFDDASLRDEVNKYFYFTNMVSESGRYLAFNQKAGFVNLKQSEAALFQDRPDLFTGRGFLWSRSIPLLKKYLLTGSGPDTFEIAFPQDDLIAMRRGGCGFLTVTKPHNIYLQIGVNTGTVSMLAFIGFYLVYMVWCVRLYYIKKAEGSLFHYGMGVFSGISAYMVSGIVNDSTVCVAPVWWCMMGLGIAINCIAEKACGYASSSASNTHEQ